MTYLTVYIIKSHEILGSYQVIEEKSFLKYIDNLFLGCVRTNIL